MWFGIILLQSRQFVHILNNSNLFASILNFFVPSHCCQPQIMNYVPAV